MKKFVAVMMMAGALGLGACDDANDAGKKTSLVEKGATSAAAVVPAAKKVRVALVMKTLTNPFFVEMEKGARRAEHDLGIELLVKTAAQETSVEQQIAIVDDLVRDHVDAIVIAPGDSIKLVPALKKAQSAGIVVVNIDNRLDVAFASKVDLAQVPFISVDNEQGAYLSAKFILHGVAAPTKAAVIEGIRSAGNAEARKHGALRAFAENPNVTVVASETANWKIDEGYDVAKVIFTRHPDVKLLFCANDMMGLGAVKYLQDAARGDVKVAGFDALEDAKQAVRRGAMAVTIDQQAAQQGFTGVSYAVRAIHGETLPAETYGDVRVISAATVDG